MPFVRLGEKEAWVYEKAWASEDPVFAMRLNFVAPWTATLSVSADRPNEMALLASRRIPDLVVELDDVPESKPTPDEEGGVF